MSKVAAVLCVAVLTVGAQAAVVDLPEERINFSAIVAREIPRGTPIDVALERAHSLGLGCQFLTRRENKIKGRTEFYFCERKVQRGLVTTRWSIRLVLREGKAASVIARVGYIGL